MSSFATPSFAIASLMLIGGFALCAMGKISEAGYLTVTLAVGAGFGLSNQAANIVKELRK